MSDVVVTLPISFGLANWIDEGDPAGEPWSGELWDFYMGGYPPQIEPGERVYVVHKRRLIGYAPLVSLDVSSTRSYSLVRGGDAVAVTVDEEIPGFRGYRYRWWDRNLEQPFPDWKAAA